jgi:hypothetical protein
MIVDSFVISLLYHDALEAGGEHFEGFAMTLVGGVVAGDFVPEVG